MGEDFARAVLCSRASINVLRPQNESAENMRTYEIPACGGVMLGEWSVQQERVFREGTEAVYARNAEELAEHAQAITRWPRDALFAIGAEALRRSAEHTYRVRAKTIMDVVTDHMVAEGANSTAPRENEHGRAPVRP
jgi:spore maturation protein CgeB